MKYLIGLFALAGKFTEGYQGGPTSLSDKAAIFCGKKRPILSFARLGQMSQWSGVEIHDEDEDDDNFGDRNDVNDRVPTVRLFGCWLILPKICPFLLF